MKLQDARALITGGSEGIGLGIARAMKARGAQVAIMGRSKEKLSKAAEDLGVLALQGDVSREADVKRVVASVVESFGGIDILVNNAGYGYFAPLTDLDTAEFEKLFATNVTGAMLVAREVAPHFIAQERGHLINISSTSGLGGGRNSTAYSGSKFALRGMTECWRAELRPHNVRVTLVNPSEVQTPFFSKLGHEQVLSEKKLRPSEIADAIVGALEIDDRGFIPEFSVFATNPF
ncbi:MAG: SDR family oxidoreductase [Gemmatimonadetes bacterium]|nr:SDR family oxidoreductase [Gemmatimonadota bacterium]